RRIAGGDTGAVVYPQRQDEIGTIASCVEICRQALTEGRDRLGEARRPAGAATDETELLQKIVDEPAPRRRREPEAPRRRVTEPEAPKRRPVEQRKPAGRPRPQTPPRVPARTPEEKAKSDYLSWLDGAGV
ncbi:MAG TPA: hypothetical protein VGL47_04310, partial [Amycolatopsis sp.]